MSNTQHNSAQVARILKFKSFEDAIIEVFPILDSCREEDDINLTLTAQGL